MTVDRKLTFFTVRHEIYRLFRLYSLVNQDMRTESCTAGHSKLNDSGDVERVQFNTYWSYWARSKRQFNDYMSAHNLAQFGGFERVQVNTNWSYWARAIWQFYYLLSARKWTRFGRFARAQFNTNWSSWARSKRQFPVTIHSSPQSMYMYASLSRGHILRSWT